MCACLPDLVLLASGKVTRRLLGDVAISELQQASLPPEETACCLALLHDKMQGP